MITCIGGAHQDRHGILEGRLVLGTSNPGAVHVSMGGVARNVAENLARLGEQVTLVSRVGDDAQGAEVSEDAARAGIDRSWFTISGRYPTASYTAILESSGELVIGLADMAVYDEITPAVLEPSLERLREHRLWFVDANLPGETIDWLLGKAGGIPVAVDALSVAKSARLKPLLPRISLLFLNTAQLGALGAAGVGELGTKAGVLTAGAAGITVWEGDTVRKFGALAAETRDVTGAGDSLIAGTLFGISKGQRLFEAARLGLAAAAITVESPHTVAPELTEARVRARLARG